MKKSYKTVGFIQRGLKEINLEFRKNEFVAILGPNDSGNLMTTHFTKSAFFVIIFTVEENINEE